MQYIRNQAVICARNDDGELALYHPETNAFFTLNSVGEWIWEALGVGISDMDLAQKLALTYEIPLPQARRDVEEFLNALQARKLVKVKYALLRNPT